MSLFFYEHFCFHDILSTSIFLIIFCIFVIVSYWLILFKKSPFIIEFEQKFFMKANFLFWFTMSKLYVLLLILADCFSTLPFKGALRIWLFWRDFGKSQIRNTYNLLSFHDSLFHGVATSGWKVLCPILLIIMMRQNKNKQFYPCFQVCKFFEARMHTAWH